MHIHMHMRDVHMHDTCTCTTCSCTTQKQPKYPSDVRTVSDVRTPRISFNAQSNITREYVSPPTHVKFDLVLYNQGGAFNPTTGNFTAPVSGTYVFYFQTESGNSHSSHSYIKVNHGEVCRAYIHSKQEHGSCQGIVHMFAGENAWVEPIYEDAYYTHNSSSFMGFLLSGDSH